MAQHALQALRIQVHIVAQDVQLGMPKLGIDLDRRNGLQRAGCGGLLRLMYASGRVVVRYSDGAQTQAR